MWSNIISMLLPTISTVLSKVIKDPVEVEKIKTELTAQLLAQETAVMNAMAETMKSDSSSDNKLVSSARPIIVYWSLFMITLIAFLGIFNLATPVVSALTGVPDYFWQLMTVGIGAFSVTRGIEKSVTAYVSPKK